jgi:nitrite reductase/ring-hydroxylating ferredoxin subunit
MTTTPGAARSRLDPEPVSRRDVLGLSALGSAVLALILAVFGAARLPRAAVVRAPSRKFRVSLPETLGPGEAYLPPGRSAALYRDADGGVYAISRVCTHLGCLVNTEPGGFNCPCHGSRFGADGGVLKGPAPQALPWLEVSQVASGTYLVDEAKTVPAGTKVVA